MFQLGDVYITLRAMQVLSEAGVSGVELLARHQALDSPELSRTDRQINRDSVENGDRILSRYTVSGVKLFIITEWDRSYTTILLAEEY